MSADITTIGIRADSTQIVSATRDLSGLEQQSRKVEKATDSVADSYRRLIPILKELAAAYGLYKLAEHIKEATLLAARYETLGIVMRVVGNNAGYTGLQMEAFVKGLEKTGISMSEARQSLTRMVQAQLDLNQSSKLARVAQDAAVIGNINSSEAFQRLVYGIQSAQVEMLRTIGINVNFEAAYQKVASATGRAVASFTEAEKSQIRMNAVMDSGTRISGTYAAAMETAGKQLMSLPRHLENLKVLFGAAFTPALAEIIETITGAVTDLNGELSGESKQKIEDWGNSFRLTLISIEAEIMRVAMFVDKLGGTLTSAQMLLYGPGRAMGFESSTKRFEAAADANIELEKRYRATEKALEDLAAKYIKLEQAMTPAGKAVAKAAADELERKRLAAATGGGGNVIDLEAERKRQALLKKLQDEDRKGLIAGVEEQIKAYEDLLRAIAELEEEANKNRAQMRAEDLKGVLAGIEAETQAYEDVLRAIAASRDAKEAADDKLLQDKMTLYKDLAGFEDEYRQVQLEWIEKIRSAEIRAGLDVTAANKKAAASIAKVDQAIFEAKSSQVSQALGDMAYTFEQIGSMYDKSSGEYAKMQDAAKTMIVLQKAVAVANAVAAIANQGLGDPYTAFARIAAMAVAMGSLMASAGISFGGGSGGTAKASTTISGSTVLGGHQSGQASESVKNITDLMKDIHAEEYPELKGIRESIEALNRNIAGLVVGIVRGYGPVGTFSPTDTGEITRNLSPILTSISEKGSIFANQIFNWIDKTLFGSKRIFTSAAGINLSSQSLQGYTAGQNVMGQTFRTTTVESKGGLLGQLFGLNKTTTNTENGPLTEEVNRFFTGIYQNLSKTAIELGKAFGTDMQKVLSYMFPEISIDLLGLSPEEIEKKLRTWISDTGDVMAKTLFGELITKYQKINEGLLETAVRLATDLVAVRSMLSMIGKEFTGTTEASIAFTESLIEMAGGLENLQEQISTYYNNFFSKSERSALQLSMLNKGMGEFEAHLPKTREGFRAIVEGIDLQTEAGQKFFAYMMSIAGMANEYYSYFEELEKQRVDLEIQLMEKLGRSSEALAMKRRLELEAMDESLRAIQEAIWAIEDAEAAVAIARKDLEAAFDAEKDRITKAGQAEKDRISKAVEAETERLNASLQETTNVINELRTSVEKLKSARESMKLEDVTWQASQFAAAQDVLEALLVQARGGNFSGLKDIDRTLQILTESNTDQYTNSVDYKRDFWKTYNAIAEIEALAGDQLSIEETIAKGIEDQIAAVKDGSANQIAAITASTDRQIAALDAQLNAILGINTTVMSLAAAIAAYQQAIAALAAAKAAGGSVLTGSGGGGGGKPNEGQPMIPVIPPFSNERLPGDTFYSSASHGYMKDISSLYGSLTGVGNLIDQGYASSVNSGWLQGTYSYQDTRRAMRTLLRQAQLAGANVPEFAEGGNFAGGWRIVGERGREVEFTGPSSIMSHEKSKALVDNTALASELQALRAEMKAELKAIAKNTDKSARALDLVKQEISTDGILTRAA